MTDDATPTGRDAYLVFAQRTDARVDIDAWAAHAARFFGTRLGLAEDKRYPSNAPAPRTDRARFVVSPIGDGAEAPGIRSAFARPRDDADLARADGADGADSGLALLARRCQTVWLVTREDEADRLALRLATVLASVLLGPILDGRRSVLFGAKTARAKLERMAPR